MTADQTNSSEEDQMLARKKAFGELLRGERLMNWADWSYPLYDSKYLTPGGRRIALRAVATLQRVLGDDYLERAVNVPPPRPIYSFSIWPANKVPWTYANLLQLAAQLELPSKRLIKVRQEMQRNLDFHHWIHSLLQLEVAGLGVRAGWECTFEPKLGNGRKADVLLTNGTTQLLVEAVAMQFSDATRKITAFFDRLFWQLQNIAGQYSLNISGNLGDLLPPETEARWFQKIEAVARETAQDGIVRSVSGPTGERIEIAKDATGVGIVSSLNGPVEEENDWSRLVARLNDKNERAAGRGPVWVRLEEHAGMWHLSPLRKMTLPERLDAIAPALREELQSFTNLAGVILSPATWWAGGVAPEAVSARIEGDDGIAVLSPIPGHRARETIIVPQAGQAEVEAAIFADWYQDEATWLDWALEQQEYPRFDKLVLEEADSENGVAQQR